MTNFTFLLLTAVVVTATGAAASTSPHHWLVGHNTHGLAFVSTSSHGKKSTSYSSIDRLMTTTATTTTTTTTTSSSSSYSSTTTQLSMSSDWGNFDYLDDDEEIDTREYAKEGDSQELKAQVGSSLEAPSIDDGSAAMEPIMVPTGSQLPLDEETVLGILQGCRTEIGTMFGYTAENRGVGITGGVDFVDMDGPIVILRLKGRFWHQRTTVLDRVSSYLQTRIPEIIDVIVEDEWQLTDEANNEAM